MNSDEARLPTIFISRISRVSLLIERFWHWCWFFFDIISLLMASSTLTSEISRVLAFSLYRWCTLLCNYRAATLLQCWAHFTAFGEMVPIRLMPVGYNDELAAITYDILLLIAVLCMNHAAPLLEALSHSLYVLARSQFYDEVGILSRCISRFNDLRSGISYIPYNTPVIVSMNVITRCLLRLVTCFRPYFLMMSYYLASLDSRVFQLTLPR
jgi:hypothetical protein